MFPAVFTQDSPESDMEREKDKKDRERESEKDRARQRSESKHKSPTKKRPGKDSVSARFLFPGARGGAGPAVLDARRSPLASPFHSHVRRSQCWSRSCSSPSLSVPPLPLGEISAGRLADVTCGRGGFLCCSLVRAGTGGTTLVSPFHPAGQADLKEVAWEGNRGGTKF